MQKYLIIFLLLVPVILAAQPSIRSKPRCHLTLFVSVPVYTEKQASIYLPCNLNGWNPADPAYKLVSSGKLFSITIVRPLGTKMFFKLTKGSWATVEKNTQGMDISNREISFRHPYQKQVIKVAGWGDHFTTRSPHTVHGNVQIISKFTIPQWNAERRIWIYLPSGYAQSGRHYPVLYMHDGQNLFDAKTSYSGEWHVDETLEKFARTNKHKGVIIVGIDNGGKERFNEYDPWFYSPLKDGGKGKLYCRFIVKTLKPYIDSHFRTLPSRKFTGIAGSSMGGLISLYAILKYPQIFSRAGLFSPSCWCATSKLLQMIQKINIKNIKIYIDTGTRENDEDKTYLRSIQAIYHALQKKIPPQNLRLLIEKGAFHNENAWTRRFPTAFLWLFP